MAQNVPGRMALLFMPTGRAMHLPRLLRRGRSRRPTWWCYAYDGLIGGHSLRGQMLGGTAVDMTSLTRAALVNRGSVSRPPHHAGRDGEQIRRRLFREGSV